MANLDQLRNSKSVVIWGSSLGLIFGVQVFGFSLTVVASIMIWGAIWFIGSILANLLIESDPENRDILFPIERSILLGSFLSATSSYVLCIIFNLSLKINTVMIMVVGVMAMTIYTAYKNNYFHENIKNLVVLGIILGGGTGLLANGFSGMIYNMLIWAIIWFLGGWIFSIYLGQSKDILNTAERGCVIGIILGMLSSIVQFLFIKSSEGGFIFLLNVPLSAIVLGMYALYPVFSTNTTLPSETTSNEQNDSKTILVKLGSFFLSLILGTFFSALIFFAFFSLVTLFTKLVWGIFGSTILVDNSYSLEFGVAGCLFGVLLSLFNI